MFASSQIIEPKEKGQSRKYAFDGVGKEKVCLNSKGELTEDCFSAIVTKSQAPRKANSKSGQESLQAITT